LHRGTFQHQRLTVSGDELALFELAAPVSPRPGERWPDYKRKVEEKLGPVLERATHFLGLTPRPLLAANGFYGRINPEQLQELRRGVIDPSVRWIDWSREVDAGQIAIVAQRIGWERPAPKPFSGRGVRVAVLDSGIDTAHPFLHVTESVSTCEESVQPPGRHGTFCAGVIASRHPQYIGIAPAVDLLNIKTSRADGLTTPAYLAQGIDEALDRRADVLSLSCGLNQSNHRWQCLDGHCLLCRAVDNAVACGAVVVTAAGNLHRRRIDPATRPRTELLCPAEARKALAVGAVEKISFPKLYRPSSRGPTAYGLPKPDLVAPGGDVLSTVPVPAGRERADPSSLFHLFGRESGTSVASAVVAGAVALLIEERTREGREWTPEDIRGELLMRFVRRLDGAPPEAVGAGCLDLSELGWRRKAPEPQYRSVKRGPGSL
jgi:serine protease AprX